MNPAFAAYLTKTLEEIEQSGLFKNERLIVSPQAGQVTVGNPNERSSSKINLCANNYLGLADHPKLIEAAKAAMDDHGYGMASVRFICGTQDIHKELEQKIAAKRS